MRGLNRAKNTPWASGKANANYGKVWSNGSWMIMGNNINRLTNAQSILYFQMMIFAVWGNLGSKVTWRVAVPGSNHDPQITSMMPWPLGLGDLILDGYWYLLGSAWLSGKDSCRWHTWIVARRFKFYNTSLFLITQPFINAWFPECSWSARSYLTCPCVPLLCYLVISLCA